MHFFDSPFQLSKECRDKLERAGLQPWTDEAEASTKHRLLLYDSPHALLNEDDILSGYKILINHSAEGSPLLAIWRVLAAGDLELSRWIQNGMRPVAPPQPPDPSPLAAFATRAYLSQETEALQAYHGLENRAERWGSPADTAYSQRLERELTFGALRLGLQALQAMKPITEDRPEINREEESLQLHLNILEQELSHYIKLSHYQHRLLWQAQQLQKRATALLQPDPQPLSVQATKFTRLQD
ncbi:hypothetical protein [Vulcanococcus limneticus]|uniref:hypothetical protein n=1 Tax=Vulcanococcus limneticus TaxID=2170428 RepID=UPI0012FF5FB1|nr:hypothetical protein [Vulcanococcus limneticus]MCP9790335.1 hypothetical protein [Vulcanococcus limneticus MW73D5]MCP9892444.1 hypothetical protein [Vulcanococcus limneticus Candia 3F8]MCP9895734.1 hypothetical protein [Vulcanococcus limneticus Candia 3B3]